jgi:hypothetical protein
MEALQFEQIILIIQRSYWATALQAKWIEIVVVGQFELVALLDSKAAEMAA